MRSKLKQISCILIAFILVAGMAFSDVGTAYAGGADVDQTLDSGSDILTLDKTAPKELDTYPDDVYGVDTSAEDPENNTPFLLSEMNELALLKSEANSSKMHRYDTLDLSLSEKDTDGTCWVKGINAANAKSDEMMDAKYLETYKDLRYVQSIAFDPWGNGRKNYIASIGFDPSGNGNIQVALQNVETGGNLKSTYTYNANWMAGLSGNTWQMDNYFAITAGDYNGDGKETVIVYIAEDGDNHRLLEFYPSGFGTSTINGWYRRSVLNLSTVLKNTTYTTNGSLKYQPAVGLATGDFDGDGTDDLAYSVGYYNNSGNTADGYQNYSCDNLEQFATRVGILKRSSGWSEAYSTSMYDQAATSMSQSGNDVTYPLTIMHGGMVAAGDVNNDGIDEIVAAGYMSLDKDDHSTSCARATYTSGKLSKVSGVCNWSDKLASSVIYYNKGFKRTSINTFQMSQALKYTYVNYCREQDDVFPRLTLVCGKTNGDNDYEDVFISGTIYDFSKLSPKVKYSPDVFASNDLSKITGGSKNNSSVNWIRNAAVGNFDGNIYGRQQFVFTLFQKRSGENYYSANVGVIAGVDYQVFKDSSGNVTGLGGPKNYACNLKASTITNSSIAIDDGTDAMASQAIGNSQANYAINIVPIACDIDDDGMLARFRQRGYVYTDPEVLAVLEAGPYFSEIDEAGGYEDPCETFYSISTGYGTATSRSDNVSFEAGIALEAAGPGAKMSYELGYAMDWSHSYESSYSVTRTSTFKAQSEDVVVISRVPQLVYTYDLWDAQNSEWIENGYSVRVPLTQRTFKLGIDEYNEFVDDFNKIVGESSQYALKKIVDGVDLPKDHVGNPDNYWTEWAQAGSSGQQLSKEDYPLGYASGSTSSEYESEAATTESEEMGHGFHFGLTLQAGGEYGVGEAWAGGYTNLDYSHSTGKSTTKVDTTVSGGQVQDIKASAVEGLTASQVRNSFGFTWNFGKWTRVLTNSSSGAEIPFYGYTVSNVKRRAKPPALDDVKMTIKEGYEAFSISDYTSGLSNDLTVTKKSGDDRITYDQATKSIKVAAGLTKGTYNVVFNISNGFTANDTTFNFNLKVDMASPGSGTISDPSTDTTTDPTQSKDPDDHDTTTDPSSSGETKPAADPEEQMGSDGTALGSGASTEAAEAAITASKSDKDLKGSVYNKLRVRQSKVTKNSITVTWVKVSGAKKYVLYGVKSGAKNKFTKIATTTKTKYTVKKINKNKLVKGTYYKFVVVALNSKGNVVTGSKTAHIATLGKNSASNPAKVTTAAKNNKVTIKVKKTFKLKGKYESSAKKYKIKKVLAIRYESTNNKIATVTSKGVVKGMNKGTCYVYVYAQNGLFKKIKVTVTKK